MLDPIRKLLTEAGKAKQVRGFWDAAAAILSEWAGGARVELSYRGLRETGSAQAGTAGKPGDPFLADYHDAEGRERDRKSTRLNSSHMSISYAVFCLKKKKVVNKSPNFCAACFRARTRL